MRIFRKKNIFVAGHNGMVGSAIVRHLKKLGYKNLILKPHKDLDLSNQEKVNFFFKNNKIDQVYLAAAKVGGIYANNNYPAEFIRQNLLIQSNVIHSSFITGVKKLLFLGSSCIYPKQANQPIKEEELLTNYLEPTNEPYAIAKIAGLKMCESYNRQYGKKFGIDYRSIMPTNLYGPGDSYHPKNSHVIPGLIYRFHLAKIKERPYIKIWGSGKPKREFLYVDDIANACHFVMNVNKKIYEKNTSYMCSHINAGSGKEVTIFELSNLIKKVVGYKGEVILDKSKPDGTPRKLLDSQKLRKIGWKPFIQLENGLKKTYYHYVKELA